MFCIETANSLSRDSFAFASFWPFLPMQKLVLCNQYRELLLIQGQLTRSNDKNLLVRRAGRQPVPEAVFQ